MYSHHFACFFQNKIWQKIFFGLNSSGKSKNWLQAKKIFLKNDQEKTQKNFASKKSCEFFLSVFENFHKKFFSSRNDFWTFQMSFSQKKFFAKFCFEKNMLGGAGRSTFQVFFQHQYAMRSSKMYISGLAQFLSFYLEVQHTVAHFVGLTKDAPNFKKFKK